MKLGIVGVGSLGMIGDVISGIGSSVNPAGMLAKLGITEWNTGIRRGYGLGQLTSGLTNSISALVGNASGSDISSSVLAASQSEAQKQMDEKQAEQEENQKEDPVLTYLKETGGTTFTEIRDSLIDIKDKLVTSGIGV